MSDETTRSDVVKYRLGNCPACNYPLWAEVEVETRTRPAHLDDNGRAVARSSASPVGMSMEHRCPRPTGPSEVLAA